MSRHLSVSSTTPQETPPSETAPHGWFWMPPTACLSNPPSAGPPGTTCASGSPYSAREPMYCATALRPQKTFSSSGSGTPGKIVAHGERASRFDNEGIMATMLIRLPNAVGPRSVRVMVVATWLTRAMAGADRHGGACRSRSGAGHAYQFRGAIPRGERYRVAADERHTPVATQKVVFGLVEPIARMPRYRTLYPDYAPAGLTTETQHT